MKVLITGAFGSLGSNVLSLLEESEHEITCFVRKSRKAKKIASKLSSKFKIFFGDIRNLDDVSKVIQNQDIIIHLAAIVPPRFTHESLDYSKAVNVDGVKNIIKAMKKENPKAKLLYPSSVAVFGDVRNRGACVLASDEPTNPNDDDIYAQQKVQAEELIQQSGLTWSIFRFGFMPNVSNLKFDPMMFDVPLDTNMEIIHVKDAALAIVHALDKKEIWGKILHLAGGKSCRLTYKEFVGGMLTAMGLGVLPDEAFGNNDFHCAFFDTDYSQKLLQYQNYSYSDLIAEMKEKAKVLAFFAKLFKPIARAYLLSQSPYYKQKKRKVNHN